MNNLLKGKSLIGLKIYTLMQGKVVGEVKDLIYEPKENRVVALIAQQGGIFSEPKVVQFSKIQRIGHDAIIIDTKESIIKASALGSRILAITKDQDYLTKTRIVTETGNFLGTVTDIFIDPSSGWVEKLEVSQGGLKSLEGEKKYVRISDIVMIGRDATIVRSFTDIDEPPLNVDTVKELPNYQPHPKSSKQDDFSQKIKSWFNLDQPQIDNKVETKPNPETSSNTFEPHPAPKTEHDPIKYYSQGYSEPVPYLKQTPNQSNQSEALQDKSPVVTTPSSLDELISNSQSKIQELTLDTRSEIQNIKSDPDYKATPSPKDYSRYQSITYNQIYRPRNSKNDSKKKDVIGKYLTKTILTDEDQILAKRGDLITNRLVNQAENYGLLDQILNNSSFEPINL